MIVGSVQSFLPPFRSIHYFFLRSLHQTRRVTGPIRTPLDKRRNATQQWPIISPNVVALISTCSTHFLDSLSLRRRQFYREKEETKARKLGRSSSRAAIVAFRCLLAPSAGFASGNLRQTKIDRQFCVPNRRRSRDPAQAPLLDEDSQSVPCPHFRISQIFSDLYLHN